MKFSPLFALAATASFSLTFASPVIVDGLTRRAPSDTCANGVGASPSGAPGQITSQSCSAESQCPTGLCCTPSGYSGPRCIGYGYGTPCTVDNICGSDYCYMGECRHPSFAGPVGLGEHCLNNCQTGLACINRTCVNPPGATNRPNGATCSQNSECASQACTAGHCVMGSLGVGDACTSSLQCSGPVNLCINGHCELRTGLGTGAVCEVNDNCSSHICLSGHCLVGDLAVGATCTYSIQCAGPLNLCVNGTCELRTGIPNGALCEVDANCTSGHCVNAKCAANGGGGGPNNPGGNNGNNPGGNNGGDRNKPDGHPCDNSDCCISGLCFIGICKPTHLHNGAWCLTGPQCNSGTCSNNHCRDTC